MEKCKLEQQLDIIIHYLIFPGGTRGKEPPANAGDSRDVGLIPQSRRSPGGGHGNPILSLAWRIPRDRGASQATVHRVTKSWDTTETIQHTLLRKTKI